MKKHFLSNFNLQKLKNKNPPTHAKKVKENTSQMQKKSSLNTFEMTQKKLTANDSYTRLRHM